eukprot:TRINITY_DN18249_c0_g2_i2.p1 TRINITY_DN18249_c0_g2~~TRINITY_DN18249_c0_g2_i2.p1  ORF type:complete len:187 (-),score=18.31 TRINITY_DN18249_c0_g2_i2:322-882(-)
MAPKRRRNRMAALQFSCANTRLCKYFQSAAGCQQGERCTFAHSEEELRAAPDLSNTRTCRLHLAGRCEAGAACRFAHGDSALRMLPQPDDVDTTKPSSHSEAVSSGAGSSAQAGGLSLPLIPYRRKLSEATESLLLWPWNRHREVDHASGHRVYRKNTFLIISDSPRDSPRELLRRCFSMPVDMLE